MKLSVKAQDIIFAITQKINEISFFAFYGREGSNWTSIDASLKGTEELGELAEAIMITTGRLPHKTLCEHHLSEIADNINQLFDMASYMLKTRTLINKDSLIDSIQFANNALIINNNEEYLRNSLFDDFIDIRGYQFAALSQMSEEYNFQWQVENIINLGMAIDKLFHFETNRTAEDYLSEVHKVLSNKLDKWKSVS